MLVSSKQIISDAQSGGYAIGAFNTSDLEITKAIIAASENLRAPVLISTSERAIKYAGLETISEMIKTLAKKTLTPIALHLDHGRSLEMIENCIKVGYTSVMFDGSSFAYEENISKTRKAVELAHKNNIPCEGELGALNGEFTNPDEVNQFVENTDVDILAISIGSKHGMEKDEPLNIELLRDINGKTSVPLVLHGASGVSEEDIKNAIKSGVCKINIDTDIRHTFASAIRAIVAKYPEMNDSRDILTKAVIEVQQLVEQKIKLFGSSGKV